MASLNHLILLGNLTRDPELRYTPNGTAVANFGLAVNRRYTQNGEQRDDVCYVDIVSFGRTAENVCEYLAKGDPTMIEGRLQWQSWETAEGQRRSKHQVVANNVQFMPRGQTDSQSGSNTYSEPRPAVSSYDPNPEVGPRPVQVPQNETAAAMPATPQTWPPRPGPRIGGQEGIFGGEPTGYGDDDDLPFARSNISDMRFDQRFRADMSA